MHELSLIRELFSIIEEEVKKHKKEIVKSVKLKVGTFSGAVPEYLKEAFQIYSVNSCAEGAKLEIEIEEPIAKCPFCEVRFKPSDILLVCPNCGRSGKIEKGFEIVLESLEIA